MNIVADEGHNAAELYRCSNGRSEPRSTWSAVLGSGSYCIVDTLSYLAVVFAIFLKLCVDELCDTLSFSVQLS